MITLVYTDDWMGVYKEGFRVYEGHSIEPYTLLTLLGIKCESLDADDDWMADRFNLPEKLEKVVL